MQGSSAKKKPENIADFLSPDSISNKESTFDMRDSLRIPYTLEMKNLHENDTINYDDLNEADAKQVDKLFELLGKLDENQACLLQHREKILDTILHKNVDRI